ncbi:hypothetical protein [Nicoliella lavandulae]|uniref:Uncharacterized protein n=1 Tax=Nicoliella lavandulae TaxID=3082954 RepID=A0ABU8SM71_9LACO
MAHLNGMNKPMSDYQRIIIETAEENPKTIAEIINGDFYLADGFRIRIKPVYDD